MKNYQMSLSILNHKRGQRLGLTDSDVLQDWLECLDCTKYLDAFALLYDLLIGRPQNEDIYPVFPDANFMQLCIDSDIIMYDMHLVNIPREMPYPYIDEKKAEEGDVIGTARMIQNGSMYECDVVIAYSFYHESLIEHIDLASMRYIPSKDILDELRERFEFHYYDNKFVEMRDKLTTHTYRISERTICYMLWEKMNFDQMKEYLLKYRESWLKVEHDVSPSEEIADFFSSKAFTEEWIEEISIVE